MNDVILAIDGFQNSKIYYSDTDSIYIHKNDYDTLNTKDLIDKELFRSIHDYGLFLCPEVKHFIGINESGILSEKTTFKGFHQEVSGVSFKDFLYLESGQTVHIISKLK